MSQEQGKQLPPCGCTDGEQCNGDCLIPKWVAIKLLAIRDALVIDDYDEAWHQLYSIASPDFDKYEPWADLENIAEYGKPSPPKLTP